MITELLGLAGSGALGSVVGMVSDALQARRELKIEEMKLRLSQEARLNGQAQDYLNSTSGFATGRTYGAAFVLLTATYCACAILCFIFPGVELLTFNPDSEPKDISILWGFLSWSIDSTHVYAITTGGVGYALLHPLAFQIGTVITGINPTTRG